MKNETNTQHTPGLDLSWENAKDGILVFYPHLTGGRPELIHKDAIEKHRQRCDEQTAGNVSAKYVPYLDAINAPELLKENQELINKVDELRHLYKAGMDARVKLQALNSELLETLAFIANVEGFENGRKNSVIFLSCQQAIAKAESKTLGVS